jgi:hypothetical protein
MQGPWTTHSLRQQHCAAKGQQAAPAPTGEPDQLHTTALPKEVGLAYSGAIRKHHTCTFGAPVLTAAAPAPQKLRPDTNLAGLNDASQLCTHCMLTPSSANAAAAGAVRNKSARPDILSAQPHHT